MVLPEVAIIALVPNLKGAQRAVSAGGRRLSMPVSASRAHSVSNIGMTPEEAVAEVGRVCAYCRDLPEAARPEVEVGLSTAFGCTMEGPVSEDWVMRMAAMLAEAGAGSIGLSDTTGYGNPAQVKRMFARLRAEVGADKVGGGHFHNTRGLGLANAMAALEAGVTTLDSSQAGLGGCPFAPGASGNIVTEDLVFLLESQGLRTGVSVDALLEARRILAAELPDEPLYGFIADAGLPKGFSPA